MNLTEKFSGRWPLNNSAHTQKSWSVNRWIEKQLHFKRTQTFLLQRNHHSSDLLETIIIKILLLCVSKQALNAIKKLSSPHHLSFPLNSLLPSPPKPQPHHHHTTTPPHHHHDEQHAIRRHHLGRRSHACRRRQLRLRHQLLGRHAARPARALRPQSPRRARAVADPAGAGRPGAGQAGATSAAWWASMRSRPTCGAPAGTGRRSCTGWARCCRG